MSFNDNFDNRALQDSECTSLGVFSRRAFFKLTAVVGALAFVGATPDGRVQAWADEKGERFFVVYILSKEEVPIMAFDVSKDTPTPLGGVKVTIVSQIDSGKTVTVTTGDNGFAPANVRALSWQAALDRVKTYNFHGSIAAVKGGYGEFYVPDYFIEAGTPPNKLGVRSNVIVICLKPLDGNPYLRQLSLDGEDILYYDGDSSDDEGDVEGAKYTKGCAVWEDNTMTHDIELEVVSTAAKATVEASILINGIAKATQTVTTGETFPYKASVKFSDQWLKRLAVNDKLGVSLKENGGKVITITSPLKFVEPVMMNKNFGLQQGFKVCPGVSEASKENVTFAKFFNRPEDSLLCQLPDFPITIFADTSGRVGASATLLEVTIFRYSRGDKKEGKEPTILETNKIAQRFSGKGLKKAWDGYKDKFSKGMSSVEESYFDYFDEDLGFFKRLFPARFTWSISLDVLVDAMGFGYAYRYGKGTRVSLDVGIKPQFNASVAFTLQFLFMCIPMYLGLDGSLKVSAMVSTGLEFGEGIKGASYFHKLKGKNWPNVYACLNLNFEIAANGGVGLSGILSAGGRGGGYIRGELDFHPRGELPCPHRVFKIGAFVDVVVQLIFIKKTIVAHKFAPRVLKDNWNEKKNELESEFEQLQNSTVGVFDDFDETEYVTDGDLANTVETYATWSEGENEKRYFPAYTSISSLAEGPFPDPWAENLYDDDDETRAAVNGVVPSTQKHLYSGCFSNPRIRIVHTDTSSFKNDRAFMLRVVVAEITPPKTTQSFASDEVWYNGKPVNAGENHLVIEEENGSRYVKPSATEAPANAPDKIYRTRIAVSEWNRTKRTWGPATMVDFYDLGEIREIDRLNSYDIDFDVELYDGSLLIAITSVQRPRGEKPTYLEQESNQYLSLVRWDIDKMQFAAAGSTFSLLGGGMSLFYPRLLMQNFDEGNGKGATLHAVVYSYACTYKNDKTAYDQGFLAATVFDDMKTTATSGHRVSNPATIVPSVLSGFAANDLVHGIFEVACPKRDLMWEDTTKKDSPLQTTAVFVWSHPAKTDSVPFVRSYVFCETFSIVKEQTGGLTKYIPTVTQHDSLELRRIPFVAKLGVCNQQALFSFPDMSEPDNRKKLRTVIFDQDNFEVDVMEDDAGVTDKTQYFASFNGRRLYCVRALHYDAPGYDKYIVEAQNAGEQVFFSDGPYNAPVKKASTETTKVRLYQLCEARWIEERQSYYDFYPIAQLNYVPDNIGVICAEKSYTSFTMASLSAEKDTADIYQVDVPVVLDWESRKAVPVAPFAAPGDSCYYTIEIRNVGNAPITAITLQASTGGTVFETRTFDKLQDYVQVSPDDHKTKSTDTMVGTDEWEWDLNSGVVETDEEGNACGEVKKDEIPLAGILWPGRRRTYCFYFKVPTDKGLHGNTKFGVRVKKVEDRMDYKNNFENPHEWPADLVVASSDAALESAVPLLAAEDYLYNDGDSDAVSGSANWTVPMLRQEDQEAWWDDEYEFEMSVDDSMYYSTDDISYPSIEVDGVDVNTKPAASTGDGAVGTVIGAAGAAAVAAAAAGAAWYEKRRAENEAGEQD